MNCPTCDTPAVSIDIRLGDTGVTFFACGTCGAKRWASQDQEIPLERILEMAAADSRMRLEPIVPLRVHVATSELGHAQRKVG